MESLCTLKYIRAQNWNHGISLLPCIQCPRCLQHAPGRPWPSAATRPLRGRSRARRCSLVLLRRLQSHGIQRHLCSHLVDESHAKRAALGHDESLDLFPGAAALDLGKKLVSFPREVERMDTNHSIARAGFLRLAVQKAGLIQQTQMVLDGRGRILRANVRHFDKLRAGLLIEEDQQFANQIEVSGHNEQQDTPNRIDPHSVCGEQFRSEQVAGERSKRESRRKPAVIAPVIVSEHTR